jgi:hypothetical protein
MQDNLEPPNLRSVAFSAFFAGVLMVLVGFWLGLEGTSKSGTYNTSVTVFNWLMRIGGIAMLIVAAMAYLNWRPILAFDAAAAVVIGGMMVLVSLLWIANNDLIQGVVVLFFGGMFVKSGIQSWLMFRGTPARSKDTPSATEQETKAPSPGRLPPRHRVTPPKPGEAEPEGFLADLGRSKEKDGDS